MINIPPIKLSSSFKAEVIPDITKTWKVGQVLSATAERGGSAQSNVLIRLGTYTLEARTPVALQTGQDIQLLVKALPREQTASELLKLPLLSIINPQPLTETARLAVLKLRQFIAMQQSFSQVQQLSEHLLADKATADKLPEPLRKLLNNIQNTLQLNANNINASQLKQKILNSGVFLESKLLKLSTAQQKTDTGLINDFKFQLLAIKSGLSQLVPQNKPSSVTPQQLNQLQTLIKQASSSFSISSVTELTDKLVSLLPKTALSQLTEFLASPKSGLDMSDELQVISKLLARVLQQQPDAQQHLLQQLRFKLILLDLGQQVDQSVSKLSSLQLQPLSREGDNLVLLLFNLIFKDSNERFDINFRIQQESKKTDQSEESWSVILSFHFRTLGNVQSKIHLTDNQISTVFHAEQQSTTNKIEQLLPLLKSGLQKAGFDVLNLAVENNLLNEKPFVGPQIRLLDENA